MTTLSWIFFGMLLLTVFLLGAHALRLAGRARNQQRSIGELNEELKRSQEYAEQQKHKLAQRSDMDVVKDEFISTVSNELRTPLTSIRGALGLLSAGLLGNVDGKAQNLLRIASSNTERLIRLINDILDLERMESGRAPLKLRRCSILDLAREAVDTMTPMADGASIHLDLTCNAPRDSIYFDADPDRILQVLTNLLSNAIKFSPEDSKVSVQIDSDTNSVALKVVDRGRGIKVDGVARRVARQIQMNARAIGHRGHGVDRFARQVQDGTAAQLQRRPAGLHPLQVENVVDQPDQALGVAGGDAQQVLRLAIHVAQQARRQQPQRPANAGQRSSQLVGDGGNELVLHHIHVGTLGQLVLLLLGILLAALELLAQLPDGALLAARPPREPQRVSAEEEHGQQ